MSPAPAASPTAPAAADVAASLRERLGADAVGAVESSFGLLCVDVALEHWVGALTAVRDDLGCGFFDWLSAVDELDDGFGVVAHLWSVPARWGLLVRTRLPRESPVLPTATGVFAGAAWHERELAEMFGVEVTGHPGLEPLLLPEGFEGHPLRKDFVLVSRAAKAWPGAKEPGESGEPGTPRAAPAGGRKASPGRRKTLPPGVPDATWGPRADPKPAPEPTAEPQP